MTSIGDEAFEMCYSLTSVICYAEKVPELRYDVFFEATTSEATLYVPASALADYKAADQWKDFGTILPLEDIPAGISNIKADETNAPYYGAQNEAYNINRGQKLVKAVYLQRVE